MFYQQISVQFKLASKKLFKPLLFVFFALMLSPMAATAVVVDGLFEVEMPILDESKAIRRAALDGGLLEVLIRVSGDSGILEKIKAPAASSYVKQYRYSMKQSADGTSSQHLWVQYNSTKILNLLRKKAIPVWGERRSELVIWLAVRDGGQRYILKQSDTSQIKEKAEAAFIRRGLPAIWPKNDSIDQAALRFADVWGGFSDPLKQASARYSSGPVIAVSMNWSGASWKSEWSLLQGNNHRKWSLKGGSYTAVITRALDLIADAMGQKFAVLEAFEISQQKQLMLEVGQVSNVGDFVRIEKYLASLSAVQSVQLSQVEPERVLFGLTLRSKTEDLLTLIQSGSVLSLLPEAEPTAIDASEEAIPDGAETVPSLPKAEPAKAEPAKAEPAKAEPAKVELPKADYRFILLP